MIGFRGRTCKGTIACAQNRVAYVESSTCICPVGTSCFVAEHPTPGVVGAPDPSAETFELDDLAVIDE